MARVPRVKNAEGKVVQVEVPWARPGSGFTLLMEAFVLTLCREMPVAAVARLVGEHDTRLWRVIPHYATSALIESINGKLQLARRKARGYRNFANFRAIAYWIAGDLDPLPTTHTI